MSPVISLLKRILTVFLVGIAFFLIQAFGYGNSLVAQAKTLTPEAESYQVEPEYTGKETFDTAKQKINDAAENVREKLNLDEPPPPSTQKFVKSVEKSFKKAIEPINGTDPGYYERENL